MKKIFGIILEKEDDRALLLSKYGLDVKPYNEERATSNSWDESDIRRWLNNEFANTAFTDAERLEILETDVDNSRAESPKSILVGRNTKDQVFLLSYKEAFEDYFTDDTERICMPTPYAVQQGASTGDDNGACLWLLRSPGEHVGDVMYVIATGSRGSYRAYLEGRCVRPALWINLGADIF